MVRALSQRLTASEKEREEESAAFNRKLYVTWTRVCGGVCVRERGREGQGKACARKCGCPSPCPCLWLFACRVTG